jgi:hypothetical protein
MDSAVASNHVDFMIGFRRHVAVKSKYLLLSLMALAAVAAICVAAIAPSHVVRARSGWSGQTFWLFFDGTPSEKQLYDEVLARESSLSADIKLYDEDIEIDRTALAEREATRRAGGWVPPEADFEASEHLSQFANWSKAGIDTKQFGKIISEELSQAEFLKIGPNVMARNPSIQPEANTPFDPDTYLRNFDKNHEALVLIPFDGKNYDVVDIDKTRAPEKTPNGNFDPSTARLVENIKAVWLP